MPAWLMWIGNELRLWPTDPSTATWIVLVALFAGVPALAYDYPLEDAFVATVVGTPADLRYETDVRVPLKRRSMQIFEDREPPDLFFYDKKLHYSYALQKGPAPLIFCIAGTGGAPCTAVCASTR